MHVCWSFLDKRTATAAAVEAYYDMKYILENTDDEIRTVRVKMEGVGAVNMDGQPHGNNDRATEDRIIDGIEKIDILRERYRQAEEYMAWFKPAWEHLTDDERFVLETFYMERDVGGAVDVIMQHYHIERSSAYNKKNKALVRLTALLYGRT